MRKETFTLGVIGAGGFARFAVNEFLKVPGVVVRAVYDSNRKNAELIQSQLNGAVVADSFDSVLNDPAIDLLYIATPPYLHYPQSKAGLLHGKHVICEKPAALRPEQAQELSELAGTKNLLFVVNLMQRYNPLYEAVQQVIQKKILGEFLHGYFENYASDESLTKQYWFWNEEQSGGIFIEHGVHFFDMFDGWLGEGKVISSQKILRPGTTNVYDRVQAITMYGGGLVNFYHGFDQPKIMDRQELRLQFEKGDITLFEWVPTKIHLNIIGTDEDILAIKNIFPETDIRIEELFKPVKIAKGRFKNICVQQRIKMWTKNPQGKLTVYQHLLQSMLTDQLRWLNDRDHKRIISEKNAVSSVQMAASAENMATCLNAEI
jgi:predicted dehydrogenase